VSVPLVEKKAGAETPDFDALIRWLLRQARRADEDSGARTALAELRRGLRDDPRDRLIVGKYIVPFLGAEPRTDWQRRQEECCYLVAALFASHPLHEGGGSLGTALAKINGESGSIEGRFQLLLAARPERLSGPLRQIVSLLAARGVPLDWKRLLEDLCAWDYPEKPVQQRWARHFYKAPHDPELDRIDSTHGDTDHEN
jgi:CRISPR system Cascade subunit CasB